MKKEISVLMLLGVVLLSGCGSDKSVTQGSGESPSKQVTTQPEQETNAKLIEASENEEVKLYAVNETDGEVHGVTVEINGSQKEFDWNILNTGTKPQVFYTDLTGDGKEEAVIIINTGRGTGLNTYDIHVLNAKDLTEIKVQNYEEIVADQIETHVAKNDDDTLAITVKTKEKEYNFNSNVELAPNYNQDKLAFGGVAIYELENQKIVSKIGASVGTSPQYVGDFHITYKFDNAKNKFIADQIKFVD
ncbi:hypothetical protein [Paenibacillus sp. TY11]|uniref:hypothetical protein n=1 Tax=Paenibacillus sp. TY11 TaxID=3448633 RepID=UPI004039EF89